MIMKSTLRHLYTVSKDCSKNISLRGKKLITPNDLKPNEIKFLIMRGLELKTSGKYPQLHSLIGRNITLLLDHPCLRLQTHLHNASNFLKMPLNLIISSKWESWEYSQDVGKFLSYNTDIIFCKAQRQKKLEELAQGSTVPIINASSCRFLLIDIMSNLLTIYQHFGTLEGITIAWIGHSCPLLNTYLTIAPTLKMQIKFLCKCGGPVSPSELHHVMSKGGELTQRVEECTDLKQVIEGAHVITITNHTEKDLKLKLADLDKYANKEWIFFHTLPRTINEVENEIFDSNRNLLWTSDINYKWICAAIISNLLHLKKSYISKYGKE